VFVRALLACCLGANKKKMGLRYNCKRNRKCRFCLPSFEGGRGEGKVGVGLGGLGARSLGARFATPWPHPAHCARSAACR